MPDRRDTIAIAATLVAEVAWLFPALGVFGVIFAQAGSPLPLALTAGLLIAAFIAGKVVAGAVEEQSGRATALALFGLVAVYLAMSALAPQGGIGLLWGPRLFGGFSSQTTVGLIAGTVAAGFLWYRGVGIAAESQPQARLLRTFRTGVLVLAVSFLAEQSFGVDCYASVMLVPFFTASLAGLAFARLPSGGGWTRTVVSALLAVIGGGFVIGSVGALVGGRGLGLLAAGWHHIVGAIIWLLELLLLPVLEAVFEFIAWLIGDGGGGKGARNTLRLPDGAWRENVEGVAKLPYADTIVQLLQYPLLALLFYLSYRLLRRAYRGYARGARAARTAERESIQGNADAAADLIALALGLLPDWMFPRPPPPGPRIPKGKPGITEVYALYFEMLAAAQKQGCAFVPSATPSERRTDIENAIPGAPVARITACFNAACYGNLATDGETLERLRRQLIGIEAAV